MRRQRPDTGRVERSSFRNLELSRIDLRVDPDAIEGRFFHGVGTDRPPDSEGQFEAVDLSIVGEIHALLGWRGLPRRGRAPYQHHRQMRFTLDDETHGEVGWTGDLQDVRPAFRRFTDRHVLECERHARERRGEHPEHQAREVLFHGGDGSHGSAGAASTAGWWTTGCWTTG